MVITLVYQVQYMLAHYQATLILQCPWVLLIIYRLVYHFLAGEWSEPELIEIAYAYEQGTNHRRAPQFLKQIRT